MGTMVSDVSDRLLAADEERQSVVGGTERTQVTLFFNGNVSFDTESESIVCQLDTAIKL